MATQNRKLNKSWIKALSVTTLIPTLFVAGAQAATSIECDRPQAGVPLTENPVQIKIAEIGKTIWINGFSWSSFDAGIIALRDDSAHIAPNIYLFAPDAVGAGSVTRTEITRSIDFLKKSCESISNQILKCASQGKYARVTLRGGCSQQGGPEESACYGYGIHGAHPHYVCPGSVDKMAFSCTSETPKPLIQGEWVPRSADLLSYDGGLNRRCRGVREFTGIIEGK